MDKIIGPFTGEYRFLSNFWIDSTQRIPITLLNGDQVFALSVEHAYQASKCKTFDDQLIVLSASTPGKAKRLGRKVQFREDWDNVKFGIMHSLLKSKFFLSRELGQKLVNTGSDYLVEVNTWGDTFWGKIQTPNGLEGRNYLGEILMMLRGELVAQNYFSSLRFEYSRLDIGKELFSLVQESQGHSFIADDVEEMNFDEVIKIAKMSLAKTQETITILTAFLDKYEHNLY